MDEPVKGGITPSPRKLMSSRENRVAAGFYSLPALPLLQAFGEIVSSPNGSSISLNPAQLFRNHAATVIVLLLAD
jgi:hypothetical protein